MNREKKIYDFIFRVLRVTAKRIYRVPYHANIRSKLGVFIIWREYLRFYSRLILVNMCTMNILKFTFCDVFEF
jgi:hypothetical protein